MEGVFVERYYETPRLVLKTLHRDAAPVVLDYYLRNKEFLLAWEPEKSQGFYTKDYHEKQLEYDTIAMERGNLLRLWIFKKSEEHRVIGTVAFNNIIRGAFQSCHLGYKLDQNEIKQGYASEAVQKGIEIIFHEYKLHRIEANIMPGNRASLRLVEKLGFYNEGLAYKYLKINGRWEDHIHMVILNEALE